MKSEKHEPRIFEQIFEGFKARLLDHFVLSHDFEYNISQKT